MKELNLFGEMQDLPEESNKKTPTMQTMFGKKDGKTCATCKHCYHVRWNAKKSWNKCEIWDIYFRGSSAASDIRVRSTACGKYEEEKSAT